MEKKAGFYSDYVQYRLEDLNKFIGGNEFLIGYLTVADFLGYEVFQYVRGLYKAELGKYQSLCNWLNNFENIASIKDCLKNKK